MRIIITGSEGFIGKELSKQCLKLGHKVVGIDLINGLDTRSADIVDHLPANADALVHLAALAQPKQCFNNAKSCFDNNILGTVNIFEAAVIKKVKHFIFASSEWVYGDFNSNKELLEDFSIDLKSINNEYALSKLVSECYLKQYYSKHLIPTTILRFSIVYGPNNKHQTAVESLFNSVKMDAKVSVGSLKAARRFINVKDVVSGIISVFSKKKSGFEIYNLSHDKLITLKEIIKTSAKILRIKPTITESDSNNFIIRNPSNKKFKRKFLWKPKIDLKTGLKNLDLRR